MSSSAGGRQRADAMRNRRLALEAATELLAEPGALLTVETISKRSGLGAGTVVRAFGGKDALLDAAISGLLEPIVDRAEQLLAEPDPDRSLRTFLAELIAFQSAHYALSDDLDAAAMPGTAALRTRLVRAVEQLLELGRANGSIRSDIEPETTSEIVASITHAIARSHATSDELSVGLITILMDGLRPPAS